MSMSTLKVILTEIDKEPLAMTWHDALALIREPLKTVMKDYLFSLIRYHVTKGDTIHYWEKYLVWEEVSETVIQVSPVLYSLMFKKFHRMQRTMRVQCDYCKDYGHHSEKCGRRTHDLKNKKRTPTLTNPVKFDLVGKVRLKIEKMDKKSENNRKVDFVWEKCTRVNNNETEQDSRQHREHCSFCYSK